jgi:hypothetical protein
MDDRVTRRSALVRLAGGVGACLLLQDSSRLRQLLAAPSAHAADGVSHTHLDNQDAGSWLPYIDPPYRRTNYLIDNDGPSVDGKALHVGLRSGDPYTGIHTYYQLPPAPEARAFELDLLYHYSPATTWDNQGGFSILQNFQFTFSWFFQGRRYEAALQYECVHDDSPEAGRPPTWRLWTGTTWKNTGVRQELAANTWHHLILRALAMPEANALRYIEFVSDDRATPLGLSFPPTSVVVSPLVVGFQLDGNFRQESYDVSFDQVHLTWWPANPW